MWTDYAEDGTGVAIMSTIERLVGCLPVPGDGNHTASLIPITYINREQQRYVEVGNSLYSFAYKDLVYQSEQEVRLAIIHAAETPNGIFAEVDVHRLVAGIVPGPRTTGEGTETLARLAGAYGIPLI